MATEKLQDFLFMDQVCEKIIVIINPIYLLSLFNIISLKLSSLIVTYLATLGCSPLRMKWPSFYSSNL